MHAHNNIPSTACHFQGFLHTCISQAHISFRFAVSLADCRGAWHIFMLNDSVIQGSLNNRCSSTPETYGVKLN